jgi:iron complex outermembrane receptor protein
MKPTNYTYKITSFICGFLILLQSASAAYSDKAFLKGKVTDALTHLPLAGASIYLHEAKTGTITNDQGLFATPFVPAGKYLVEISFQGYQSIIETIEIKNITERNFEMQLTYAEH